jgi:hypothetical protein
VLQKGRQQTHFSHNKNTCVCLRYDRTMGLVFEICEGGQLNKLLHTRENQPLGNFTSAQKLRMAKDVSVGLDYLHNMRSLRMHLICLPRQCCLRSARSRTRRKNQHPTIGERRCDDGNQVHPPGLDHAQPVADERPASQDLRLRLCALYGPRELLVHHHFRKVLLPMHSDVPQHAIILPVRRYAIVQ